MNKAAPRKMILREKSDPTMGDLRNSVSVFTNGHAVFVDFREERRMPGEPLYREPTGTFFTGIPTSKIDEFIEILQLAKADALNIT